ncbi:unnamed protein product [Prorocentrum cordatum]|uniref:Putative hydroxypyruvate isomerase n=1 Tax=Prorocentrum cordatum TaxID=2364126 RepID=A0ABN9VR34_9DINO|nr:unnamed protein product [Polarella glacialis]
MAAARPPALFAANLSTLWPEAPFLARFALARRAGFRLVEAQWPQHEATAPQVREQLDRHGLRMVLMNLSAGSRSGDLGLAADPSREREFEASLAEGRAFAAEVGVPKVHCLAGMAAAGVEGAAAQGCYVERLRRAADALGEDGRQLLIEPLSVPGYHLGSLGHAMATLEEVDRTNARLQFDFYHVQRLQGNVAEALRSCLGRIGHVQLAGVPGRHEPDEEQELNFPFLLAELRRLGYAGPVGCEYTPRPGGRGMVWKEAYDAE